MKFDNIIFYTADIIILLFIADDLHNKTIIISAALATAS